MSFSPPQCLNAQVASIGIAKNSSPALVVFDKRLYFFYLGSGLDGIYYTRTRDGITWDKVRNIRDDCKNMGVAPNTSPCAVVLLGLEIFLFYNGAGNDGTWYTTFKGRTWTRAESISSHIHGQGCYPGTSPSAAMDSNYNICLFWNGSGDDGIFFTSWHYMSRQWTKQEKVKDYTIAKGTTPCAVTLGSQLYLFWNGRNNDGSFYVKKDLEWGGPVTSVNKECGGMGFLPGTSPAALVLGNTSLLRLFWVGTGGAGQGPWYSTFNKTKWTQQQKMADVLGVNQNMAEHTNPAAIQLNLIPYVFWVGDDKQIWFCSGIKFSLTSANFFGPDHCFQLGQSFTVTSNNAALAKWVKEKLGSAYEIPPKAPSSAVSTFVGKLTQGWDFEAAKTWATQMVRIFALCTMKEPNEYFTNVEIVEGGDVMESVVYVQCLIDEIFLKKD